jgi:hypothetical protein
MKTIQLLLQKTEEGNEEITIFSDPEKRKYFAHTGTEDCVQCPDLVSGFDRITLHKNCVECCGNLNSEEEYIRIYLLKTREWLTFSIDLNFLSFIGEGENYLHLSHLNGGLVYDLKNAQWVSIRRYDLGMIFFRNYFKKVEEITLHGRAALFLTVNETPSLNPYSVHFLDTAEVLSLPLPDDDEMKRREKDKRITIFSHIFEKYAVVSFSAGGFSHPDAHYIWSFVSNKYFSDFEDQKFSYGVFTEQYLVVHLSHFKERNSSKGLKILKSDTFEPIKIDFSYKVSFEWIDNISIDKKGNIVAVINGPKEIQTTIV